jgi:hypothetical protein
MADVGFTPPLLTYDCGTSYVMSPARDGDAARDAIAYRERNENS